MGEQPHRRRKPQTAISSMPIDKQQNGKPFTPIISSNLRSAKSPLTPRLAGSALQSPAPPSQHDTSVRQRSPTREALSTAVPVPLGNLNITPRSAARRSRIGTESPATPGSNRDAIVSRARATSLAASTSSLPISTGLGISSPSTAFSQLEQAPAHVISPTPVYTVPRKLSGARSAIQDNGGNDEKFFRSDALRSYTSLSSGNEQAFVNPKKTSFFYIGGSDSQNVTSPNSSTFKDGPNNVDKKFFHASDVRAQSTSRHPPRVGAQAKPHFVSGPGPAPQRSDRSRPGTPSSRSSSPHKTGSRPMQALLAPSPVSPPMKAFFAGASEAPVDPSVIAARRISIGSNVSSSEPATGSGHKKSNSAISLGAYPRKRISLSHSVLVPASGAELDTILNQPASPVDLSQRSLHSPEPLSPRSPSLTTSSNTVGTSLTSEGARSDAQKRLSGHSIGSPTASISSPTLHVSTPATVDPPRPAKDEASNARRERKVLDLEISNSSLLAINKTLERELRKQGTELRRFKRLSKSGRLSFCPTSRSVSASTMGTVAEFDENDSASEQADDSDVDELDDDDIPSNDSSSLRSPKSRAHQRAREEKRLILDLQKHQQMLLDSQKLTQSIRRCLTCTEELIRDGNKAIEYRAGIGSRKLGGTVLPKGELDRKSEDESEDEQPRRQGLLSPSIETSNLTEANLWVANSSSSLEPKKEQVLSANVERLFAELLEPHPDRFSEKDDDVMERHMYNDTPAAESPSVLD